MQGCFSGYFTKNRGGMWNNAEAGQPAFSMRSTIYAKEPLHAPAFCAFGFSLSDAPCLHAGCMKKGPAVCIHCIGGTLSAGGYPVKNGFVCGKPHRSHLFFINMDTIYLMKKQRMVYFMMANGSQPVFQGIPFFHRFSSRRVFLPLLALFCCGVQTGTAAGVYLDIFQSQRVLPLFFSGIPFPEAGFFSCFSTFLLNMLIGLLALFLLGMTAFGMAVVPVFLFVKGAAVGLGVLSFLMADELSGMGQAAFLYTPVMAAGSLLLLFFAGRAMAFSRNLARSGLASREDGQGFRSYFRDLLIFLSFSVAVAFVGAFFAIVYCKFFI